MALIAPKSENTDFERCPTGLQPAICVYVVDMGLQITTMSGLKPKLRLVFETQALISEGEYAGKPFMQSSEFTFSMFKSAYLRMSIQSWRGAKLTDEAADLYDFEKLLGQQATLNIIENTAKDSGKVYSNIENILPAQKDVVVSASGTALPEWIQKRAEEGKKRQLDADLDQRPADEKSPPVEAYEADAQAAVENELGEGLPF